MKDPTKDVKLPNGEIRKPTLYDTRLQSPRR